jgi:tRNA 2-selenouridine synthase
VTGSGKSRLLRALAAAGAQVLDLEDLARHRGSVLGSLPAEPQPSQKRFETLVWDSLRRYTPDRPVFVEAESKKVGNLQVPEALMAAMRAAPCLRLELPHDQRVALLKDEYTHFLADAALLNERLATLAPLHGHVRLDEWRALAEAARWDELVGRLLEEHYDPAYLRGMARNYAHYAAAPALLMDDRADFEAAAREALTLADRAP